jgi:hypothetical protein
VVVASISGGVATTPMAGVDIRQEGLEGARSCSRRDKDGAVPFIDAVGE